jgi:DNA-binding response OmpR family regulator
VLLVEDEPGLVLTLTDRLSREGYDVQSSSDGESGLARATRETFDLVLLDVMLPRLGGFDVVRELRKQSIETPVIMLTARGQVVDKVVGLKLGADDYVTKPFSPRELTTRVRTVLRRARPAEPPVERVSVGPLELDAATREARRDGVPLPLTAKEFDLLWFLASNPNRVFSRDQLMDRVWGYSAALDTGTVTVHVRRVREKLEADPSAPRLLETVWGVGYRLCG